MSCAAVRLLELRCTWCCTVQWVWCHALCRAHRDSPEIVESEVDTRGASHGDEVNRRVRRTCAHRITTQDAQGLASGATHKARRVQHAANRHRAQTSGDHHHSNSVLESFHGHDVPRFDVVLHAMPQRLRSKRNGGGGASRVCGLVAHACNLNLPRAASAGPVQCGGIPPPSAGATHRCLRGEEGTQRTH